MTKSREELRAEAIAEGYKDETCPKCGAFFEAHIHFIRCFARPCAMMSTSDPRTIAEHLVGCTVEEAKERREAEANI